MPATDISSIIFQIQFNDFDCFFGPECFPPAGLPLDVYICSFSFKVVCFSILSYSLVGLSLEIFLGTSILRPDSYWFCNTLKLRKKVVQ